MATSQVKNSKAVKYYQNYMPLKINEIFKSIQGESTFAGLPCTFIRLTNCNLRCNYCDTKYAYEKGTNYNTNTVFLKVKELKCNIVEITGGEPLLQKDVYTLIEQLLCENYLVLVETNGTVDLTNFISLRKKGDLRFIFDIKTPGSGMQDKVMWENIKLLNTHDEIKFVIGTREDFEWAVKIDKQYSLNNKHNVLFSPIFSKLAPDLLCNWIINDNLNIRLNLQIHKIIWGEFAQGV